MGSSISEGLGLLASAGISQFGKGLAEAVKNKIFNSWAMNSAEFAEAMQSYYELLLERTNAITLLALRKKSREIETVYIPLTLQNTETMKTFDAGKNAADLVEISGRILITDKAGMGKSTFSKWLIRRLLAKGGKIPVFIELRRVNSNHLLFDEIFKQISLAFPKLKKQTLDKGISLGGFVFVFDAIDEISFEDRLIVFRDMLDFITKYALNSFVITSRPMDELGALIGFDRFNIKPLRRDEAYSLLRKFDDNGDVSNALIDELERKSDESLFEYLAVPLLVGMLYRCYEFKQTIPLSRQLFYRQVYEALFENHDLTKDLGWKRRNNSNLDIEGFRAVLRKVAASTYSKGKVEFLKEDILTIIGEAKAKCLQESFSSPEFLTDLTGNVPVFTREGFFYRWSHKSLQEYFCVDYVKEELPGQRQKFFKLYSEQSAMHENLLSLASEMMPLEFADVVAIPLLKDYLVHCQRFPMPRPGRGDSEYRNYLAYWTFGAVIRKYAITPEIKDAHPREWIKIEDRIFGTTCPNCTSSWSQRPNDNVIRALHLNNSANLLQIIAKIFPEIMRPNSPEIIKSNRDWLNQSKLPAAFELNGVNIYSSKFDMIRNAISIVASIHSFDKSNYAEISAVQQLVSVLEKKIESQRHCGDDLGLLSNSFG